MGTKEQAESLEREEGANGKAAGVQLMWVGMTVLLYLTVVGSALGSSWEVFTVLLAEQSWSWTDRMSALYLAAGSALQIPVSLFGSDLLAHRFSDRAIALPCFAMSAASGILFFDFGLDGASPSVVFSAGSLVFLTALQLGRGFFSVIELQDRS